MVYFLVHIANRLTVAVSDILSPGPGEEDISRSMSTTSLDRAINDGEVSPQVNTRVF